MNMFVLFNASNETSVVTLKTLFTNRHHEQNTESIHPSLVDVEVGYIFFQSSFSGNRHIAPYYN